MPVQPESQNPNAFIQEARKRYFRDYPQTEDYAMRAFGLIEETVGTPMLDQPYRLDDTGEKYLTTGIFGKGNPQSTADRWRLFGPLNQGLFFLQEITV